ncbi:MAG TPA: hypothetical protein VND93_24050 [Myxococcales bacterium]|nr:hypothetical protein [Myxococcales bacterium]
MLAGAVAAGLAARLWLAFTDDGIYWPDEIYQSLEPAHRAAFGYGLRAWELVEGARCWALPGVLAGVMAVLRQPEIYLPAIRVLFCLCGVGTALGAARLARTCGADLPGAAAAGACCALLGLGIFFGPRAMSETASALPVVLGLSLVLERDARAREMILGGSLLGIAAMFRLQAAVFAVGALLAVGITRPRQRRWLALAATLAAWAFLFGLLDRVTWGSWFHSARAYLAFNLLEGQASRFGVLPASFYRLALYRSLGPVIVLLPLLALASLRRAPWPALLAFGFFALHLWPPHKELRFLWPALPLLCSAAGVGISQLARLRERAALGAAALLLALSVWSAAKVPRYTPFDLGVDMPSAFDDGGPENRLLLQAHRLPDLCGLAVRTRPLGYLGGYAYLHRPVPLYGQERPPPPGAVNYEIAPGPRLRRVLDGPCTPDPGFDDRLP